MGDLSCRSLRPTDARNGVSSENYLQQVTISKSKEFRTGPGSPVKDTQNVNIEPDEDEPLTVFNNEDAEEGLQGSTNSFVGKLFTKKIINNAWIQSAMQNIWKHPQGLRIVELKSKIYQIFFQNEADFERVLK
ncbi:hypothetical protein PIB30_037209 [Stylosanthes scabra]|uniref:DUF4283 domain-containing protein n=1 Tax=Stylosanthes scabra TaxID=79078 RepID=A0ABU6YAZ1_9FABA|nr:hypothetical protein [Stylosanthes scabra]